MSKSSQIVLAAMFMIALSLMAVPKVYASFVSFSKSVDSSGTVKLVVCGDLNDDQVLDVLDVVKHLKIKTGDTIPISPLEESLGDLTRDNLIDSSDVVEAINRIIGLESESLGCGPPN